MKKSIFLAASLAVLAFASCSKSDDNENKNDVPASNYQLNADGLTLVKWTNSSTTTLDMQADSKLQRVNTIGKDAFKSLNLTSIVFPNSLKEIGDEAFSGTKLTGGVKFNTASNVVFGKKAFYFSDIVSVQLPYTTEISNSMFSNCYYLKEVTFGKVGVISNGAFHSCQALTQIDLKGSGVREIGEVAFSNCTALTKVFLPASVEKIGDSAFGYCKSLQSITIDALNPPTLTSDIFFGLNADQIPNIYVPAISVNDYKKATQWSTYAAKIHPKP
ncbi:leucine-rich repeat domain-containing protein [Capnocytophaga leadbetteri]|uniref:leucine-rich repeat domain-containing protein n=1 Tax=Capnocytophaga leadbetteri TaxID=327575 RepID=UPI0028D0F045|nr:leucine-rich repeat domain-containing protein [Capnocytophaga leadbetteri]